MGKRWRIRGFDGLDQFHDSWASGRLSERQIQQLLARLQSRHLEAEEVIQFTVNSAGVDRTSQLVQPLQGGKLWGYMTLLNPHYTATLEDPKG